MNELALFAGAGGGILGGHLLGWRTVCAVEWEPYPASVLCARQNDGLLPPFPIWDDVRTFDGKPWAGIVDVVSGGFPCQDISSAGGGQESPVADQDSGKKWRGLLGKYDHVTHSWKTAQCSLLADLEQCLKIWPRWGLMRDGVSYQQQTLVRHTSERESGLWLPTPDTSNRDNKKVVFDKNATSQSGRSLATYARTFPTPTVMDATLSCKGKAGAKGKHSVQLSHLATSGALITDNHWETQDKLREMGMLSAAEKRQRFPTVTATVNQLAPSMQSRYANPIWPTPTAHNAKETNAPSESNLHTPTLAAQAGGHLNPDWVEWLMNWPITWSNFNAINPKEFKRWQEASAEALQEFETMRTMWWDQDPSQAPFGQQPDQQFEKEFNDSLQQMPRNASCKSEMEGSHQRSDLFVLRDDLYIQTSKRKNLHSGMREQISLDETKIIPRVANGIAARVDRLKAIGNGQVPAVAATAFRLLTEDL